MNIAVAADHGGVQFKAKLVEELKAKGHEVNDFGTDNEDSCDYPDFGMPAVRSVVDGENERGILICTNGIGMSMLANRHKSIRAALVYNERTSETTRRHHGSNVLCLGASEFSAEELLKFTDIWLNTPFDGGRHERRVGKYSI